MLWLAPCTADTDMLAERDELEGEEQQNPERQLVQNRFYFLQLQVAGFWENLRSGP